MDMRTIFTARFSVFVILFAAFPAKVAVAQLSPWKVPLALSERTAEMSLHELSRLRLASDKDGDTVLTFGFTTKSRVKLMSEHVVLRLGNSSVGEPLIQPLWAARNNEYSVKLDKGSAEIVRKFGAEVFVAGEFQSQFFLLSNTLTLGSAKSQVTTSPISNVMRAKIATQLQRIKDAGPKYDSVPAGFTLLPKASPVTKGMSVRYFGEGRWSPAEYLGKDGRGNAVLRTDPSSREVMVTEAFNVAVADEQIAVARKNMQAYQPSLELLPDSAVVVPEGFMLNAFLRKLEPGVPVRVHVKGEFYDGFVTKADGNDVTVRGHRIPGGEVVADFYSVIMTREVHQKLSKLWFDEKRDFFAKYLSPDNSLTPLQAAGRSDLEDALVAREAMEAANSQSTGPGVAAEPHTSEAPTIPRGKPLEPNSIRQPVDPVRVAARKLKSYPIKLPPPSNSSVLSNSVPLTAGVQLGCSWGSRWFQVTVVDVYSDSTVRIHWKDFGHNWDCDVARSDLIVTNELKATLEGKAELPEMMPRLWKDASEKFEVLAYLESATGTSVRLIKLDGHVLSLPLEKLSQSDQSIVRQQVRAKR